MYEEKNCDNCRHQNICHTACPNSSCTWCETVCGLCYEYHNWKPEVEPKAEPKVEPKGLKYDQDKLRLDLVPPGTMEAIGEPMTYGANKYEANSWQNLDDFKARYMGALLRHIEAYRRGELKDPESGIDHLKHALANLSFLVWKERNDNV